VGEIDSDLGWGNLVAGGLEIQQIPGNHFNMFTVRSLSRKIEGACSAQVDEQTPSLLDIAKMKIYFRFRWWSHRHQERK